MYCSRVLDDTIALVPTDVFGATSMFLGVPKGVTGAIMSYHVLLISLPRTLLYTMPHRDSMELQSPFIDFNSTVRSG